MQKKKLAKEQAEQVQKKKAEKIALARNEVAKRNAEQIEQRRKVQKQ